MKYIIILNYKDFRSNASFDLLIKEAFKLNKVMTELFRNLDSHKVKRNLHAVFPLISAGPQISAAL